MGLAEVARPLTLATERRLPVVDELSSLLDGGVRRGSTVVVVGSMSLALALAAAPSAEGSWVGAVALPDLGVVAAAERGIVLDRLALVPAPGAQWAAVVAAMIEAIDVVLIGVPSRAGLGDVRRLVARARERGALLVPVVDDVRAWPEAADLRMRAAAIRSRGLGAGHGHLEAIELDVEVTGRGAAARGRRATVVLGVGDSSHQTTPVGKNSHLRDFSPTPPSK